MPSKIGKALGSPVMAADEVMIEHCGTMQGLSTDRITYRNDFGNEMEVSCMTNAKKAKTQMLAGEYNGEKVREETPKATNSVNHWSFCLAADASQAEPIEEAPKYDGEQMI